jgi:hypothetical protein
MAARPPDPKSATRAGVTQVSEYTPPTMTNALSLDDRDVDPASVDIIYERAIWHSVVQAADQDR